MRDPIEEINANFNENLNNNQKNSDGVGIVLDGDRDEYPHLDLAYKGCLHPFCNHRRSQVGDQPPRSLRRHYSCNFLFLFLFIFIYLSLSLSLCSCWSFSGLAWFQVCNGFEQISHIALSSSKNHLVTAPVLLSSVEDAGYKFHDGLRQFFCGSSCSLIPVHRRGRATEPTRNGSWHYEHKKQSAISSNHHLRIKRGEETVIPRGGGSQSAVRFRHEAALAVGMQLPIRGTSGLLRDVEVSCIRRPRLLVHSSVPVEGQSARAIGVANWRKHGPGLLVALISGIYFIYTHTHTYIYIYIYIYCCN
uniref:Uncharacterized protein n=1 Tax=Physcomitrium patens TaxID=3218 RepID=A0A2K1JBF4_PHYPA|nr:hypothetical protein PHYPA_019112 [Physcomitrium patens]